MCDATEGSSRLDRELEMDVDASCDESESASGWFGVGVHLSGRAV